jgi:alginate O-acetyltransferase complex protein AlgI
MSFASKGFFLFLPLVLLIYHLLRIRSYKYGFLLAASWLFYMSWNPWFIWVILFTTAIDYTAGLLIEGAGTHGARRGWLLLSLATNLGFLAAFKYTGFFVTSALGLAAQLGWQVPEWTAHIILPLGISFHTFQGISYTLDVYRGKIRAVRSFGDFALFVAFFPQLVAGPIVRAVDFLPQMVQPPPVTSDRVVEGMHWFLLGLFKKVVLADNLAGFVDGVFANPSAFDAVTHRWAALAYAAQIYCDFSGYSDLAIGCAKWFGFDLPQNFNFPFLAGSITEFWRRWHISLSTWLRDYLYYPLGGNRLGTLRTYVNLMVTMTLCGLWHGATWNYVFWGFYNGALLSLHRIFDRLLKGRPWADRIRSQRAYRGLAVACTLWLFLVGLVFLRTQSWAGCWQMEHSLVGAGAAGPAHWAPAWMMLLVGLVAAGHLFSGLQGKRCGLLALPAPMRACVYAATVVLLVTFAPAAAKTFIYFQF